MRYLALAVLTCWLACGAVLAAGLLPNGDFETGLTGWEIKADAGATGTASSDKPHAGKASLALRCVAKATVCAVSPPLEGAQAGQVLQVVFFARRTQGASALVLDLVNSAAQVGDLGIWEAQLPADANWHKVSLLVKLPPLGGDGQTRLAFKALGDPGLWQLDDVSVQPATAPAFAAVDQGGVAPVTNRLPASWAPEGTLDAKVNEIGGDKELSANVNGIEVTVRPEFTCYRGFREPITCFGVNRGDFDKTLHVELSGPLGVDCPAWDIPIRKTGTTTFHLGIQSLVQGQQWLKFTFTSGGQSTAVPVRMTVRPSYPVLGAYWQDSVTAEALQAARQMPLDLQVLAAPPDASALGLMAAAAQQAGAEYVAAPLIGSLTPVQYAAAVGSLCDALRPTFWLPYCGSDPNAAFIAAPGLVGALRAKQLPAGVFTPPLELTRDPAKGGLLPLKVSLLSTDRVGGLLSLTCRLPRLRPNCVLSEQVDDSSNVAGGAALAQWRQSDLGALRGLLNDRRLNLPLLVDRLQSAPGGDERLEALSLAKALVNCLYQGSTGVVLDGVRTADNAFGALPATDEQGKPRLAGTVVRLVQEELASAAPLVPLLTSADVSTGANTAVTCRTFLRSGEGIVVLWNNTSVPKDVTLEFRSQPVVSRRVVLSYGGEFVTERWEPIMRFTDEAFKRGIPSIYLHLEPLQVQMHSFRLLDPHVAWMRNIALTAPYVAPKETPIDHKETRTWWTDMLKGKTTGTIGK